MFLDVSFEVSLKILGLVLIFLAIYYCFSHFILIEIMLINRYILWFILIKISIMIHVGAWNWDPYLISLSRFFYRTNLIIFFIIAIFIITKLKLSTLVNILVIDIVLFLITYYVLLWSSVIVAHCNLNLNI